jgi:serine/threonine-protein kinase RsbW
MSAGTVRLDFGSTFEMLDFVQVVCDHVGRMSGLDDDSVHWLGVAVRESVINAIKHGNALNEAKRVFVEFTPLEAESLPGVSVRVRDQGVGFDPASLPDPLAPDNLLKSSGRGIFLIRSFMDHVDLRPAAGGGMEVVMVKRAAASTDCSRRTG